jgi:hypothetical protein
MCYWTAVERGHAINILDRPLSELRGVVSTRLLNCLAGYGCLREVAALSERELLLIPNLGQKSIAELRGLLSGEQPSSVCPKTTAQENAITRRLEALSCRTAGQSYREIAGRFGVSVDRARQLVIAGEAIEKTMSILDTPEQ